MPFATVKSAYLAGARAGAPFVLVIAPFSVLFGVVATEAGFNLLEVMAFSVLVIAGAAQFTAVQLMTENAPTVIVLISALAVNLRMAMYSAALVPYLGPAPKWQRVLLAYFLFDQPYAVASVKYDADPDMPVDQRVAYFLGSISPIVPLWYACTFAGAVLGQAIPPEYALDFAVPITFLAIVAPAIRSIPHLIAVVVAACLALLLVNVPYNLGMIIAALAAMGAAAEAERRIGRRPLQ